MPFILLTAPELDPAQRAQVARAVTHAVVTHQAVPPDKVQLFYRPASGPPAITIHLVASPGANHAPLAEVIRRAASSVRLLDDVRVAVHGYPPDHTATGGWLRRAT